MQLVLINTRHLLIGATELLQSRVLQSRVSVDELENVKSQADVPV